MTPDPTHSQDQETARRAQWKTRRAALERKNQRGWESLSRGFWMKRYKHQAILLFGSLLKATGFYRHGYRRARDLAVRHVDVFPKNLPESFRGYRVLHLSDLHLDSFAGLGERIEQAVAATDCDLCVVTGDYRYARFGAYKQILPPLRRIVESVTAADGVYGVLGNHDTQAMTEDLEALGLRLLVNQWIPLHRGKDRATLMGLDDPHDYHTPEAETCLKTPGKGFSLLMVHTPELYRLAAASGIDLYLCGHSHGGQICLPGGLPLMTYLNTGKRYYRGLWKYGDMIGHTSPGCGTSKIPIRFNCRPEITVLTLKAG
jgi:predicted MPP superfamily phosphohydrolase